MLEPDDVDVRETTHKQELWSAREAQAHYTTVDTPHDQTPAQPDDRGCRHSNKGRPKQFPVNSDDNVPELLCTHGRVGVAPRGT